MQLLDELAPDLQCVLIGALERHGHERGVRAKAGV